LRRADGCARAKAAAGPVRRFNCGSQRLRRRLPSGAREAGRTAELATRPCGALRSNNRGESVHERVCPSAHAWPAPLRSSAPQRRAAPDPQPPWPETVEVFDADAMRGGAGLLKRRMQHDLSRRGRRPAAWAISVVARSAGQSASACAEGHTRLVDWLIAAVWTQRTAGARSEFCDGPAVRASQRSRCAASTATVWACVAGRLPRRPQPCQHATTHADSFRYSV